MPKDPLQDRLRQWLDSREFYELMAQYRHAPVTSQEQVVQAFEYVKNGICEKVKELSKPT